MYSVLLNNENYFAGSFAKVGTIPGGIMLDTLPPDINGEKSLYWKYGKYEIEKIIQVPVQGDPIQTPVIDESTGEQKIGEDGELMFTETPGTVTYEDQTITETVTGWYFDKQKYQTDVIDRLKKEKIEFIDNYKHEARITFPYGSVGGVQYFRDKDINFINLTIKGFESGDITEVKWKYSNGNYETVTDVAYLENMLRIGGMLINKSFAVESQIVDQINALNTVDGLMAYNEKAEFDKLFFSESI